jgi:hypothetical protein
MRFNKLVARKWLRDLPRVRLVALWLMKIKEDADA